MNPRLSKRLASNQNILDLLYSSATGAAQAADFLDAMFAIDDSQSLEELSPHLERMEQIFKLLDSNREHAYSLLEQVPLAVIVLGESGEILEMNSLAEYELQQSSIIHSDKNRLIFSCQKDADCFFSILQQRIGQGKAREATVLTLGADSQAMQVMIRQGFVASLFAEDQNNHQAVCVSFIPSETKSSIQEQWLIKQYALTRKEASIAIQFARNPNITNLAKHEYRSEETIRSQIKSIYAKTGVHGQAELMRLLLEQDTLAMRYNEEQKQCPFEKKTIQLSDGYAIGYEEYGPKNGLPVLYLHSFTGCRTECAHHLDVLKRLNIRMIAIDRKGYGLSTGHSLPFAATPSYICQVVDTLQLERFSIVAMSGSTAHALACAAELGDRIRQVTLISPMGRVRVADDVAGMMPFNRRIYELILRCPESVIRFLSHLMMRAFSADPEAYLKRVIPNMAEADQRLLADPEIRGHVKQTFVDSRARLLRGFSDDMIRYAQPWDIDLEKINVPISIWQGTASRHIPASMAKKLIDTLPKCRAHILTGEGYYINFSYWEDILTNLVSNSQA